MKLSGILPIAAVAIFAASPATAQQAKQDTSHAKAATTQQGQAKGTKKAKKNMSHKAAEKTDSTKAKAPTKKG